MTVLERVAYLKGLAEGLELKDSNETKLLRAIVDVINELAVSLDDTDENVDVIHEHLLEVDEDLADIEDIIYGELDEFDEDDCDCGCEDCADYDDELDDDELYEVQCPICHQSIYLEENVILDGEIDCPSCGEKLELDIEIDEDDTEE